MFESIWDLSEPTTLVCEPVIRGWTNERSRVFLTDILLIVRLIWVDLFVYVTTCRTSCFLVQRSQFLSELLTCRPICIATDSRLTKKVSPFKLESTTFSKMT